MGEGAASWGLKESIAFWRGISSNLCLTFTRLKSCSDRQGAVVKARSCQASGLAGKMGYASHGRTSDPEILLLGGHTSIFNQLTVFDHSAFFALRGTHAWLPSHPECNFIVLQEVDKFVTAFRLSQTVNFYCKTFLTLLGGECRPHIERGLTMMLPGFNSLESRHEGEGMGQLTPRGLTNYRAAEVSDIFSLAGWSTGNYVELSHEWITTCLLMCYYVSVDLLI